MSKKNVQNKEEFRYIYQTDLYKIELIICHIYIFYIRQLDGTFAYHHRKRYKREEEKKNKHIHFDIFDRLLGKGFCTFKLSSVRTINRLKYNGRCVVSP